MDCLKYSVYPEQADADGCYEWMSIRAGKPSKFCDEVTFKKDIIVEGCVKADCLEVTNCNYPLALRANKPKAITLPQPSTTQYLWDVQSGTPTAQGALPPFATYNNSTGQIEIVREGQYKLTLNLGTKNSALTAHGNVRLTANRLKLTPAVATVPIVAATVGLKPVAASSDDEFLAASQSILINVYQSEIDADPQGKYRITFTIGGELSGGVVGEAVTVTGQLMDFNFLTGPADLAPTNFMLEYICAPQTEAVYAPII